MTKTLRLVLAALIAVIFAGCLIPVPVPVWGDGGGGGWDDGGDHDGGHHHRHPRGR
jgi:hypothetical protein